MLTQVCVKMAEEIVLTGPKTSLQEDLTKLYSQGFLTDITLSTEDGKNFEAHRILLAARSHYFHSIVPRLKSEPVIFLKGVKGAHLDKILKYIYSGSVSLSRHQLKPILEVAKSLQVKGLYDANPADILSRQGLTGPSPSAVQSIASRTGGNPAMIAAMHTARAQQRQMVSPPAVTPVADKPPTFRPSSSSSSTTTLAANRTNKAKILGPSFKPLDDDSESDDEIISVNKSKADSDLDDDDEDNDDDQEESDRKTAATSVQSRADTPPKPKRKRGRPPKNKKNDTMPTATTSESKGSDPYDFDAADDNAGTSATSAGQMRTMQATIGEDKSKQWRVTAGKKSKEDDEDEAAAAAKREVKIDRWYSRLSMT